MIEHELAALADRVAPEVAPDLSDRVAARIAPAPRRSWRWWRGRRLVAGAVAAVAGASLLVPQVRAAAGELLAVAGIDLSEEAPDAPPEPRAPLPDRRPTALAEARAAVDFPVGVPARLGRPDEVAVADDGRVVAMTWQDRGIVLDQFDGRLGPVFGKDIGAVPVDPVRVGDTEAWWIGAPHDLTYLDRSGHPVTATARLAGPSLVWETDAGVTLRLEGERLGRADAVAIARSVR